MNDIKLDIKLDNTYVIECKSGLKICGFTRTLRESVPPSSTVSICSASLARRRLWQKEGDCGMNYLYSLLRVSNFNYLVVKEAINKGRNGICCSNYHCLWDDINLSFEKKICEYNEDGEGMLF